MSIINNIKLGVLDKRSKFNLSQDTHMTSNIGACIPSFCREVIPNTHISVGLDSQVRLAQMNLPTMGKLSLRHYHCFVPYNSIYFPFDAFISKVPYNFNGSEIYVPGLAAKATLGDITKYIIQDFSICTLYSLDSSGGLSIVSAETLLHDDTLSTGIKDAFGIKSYAQINRQGLELYQGSGGTSRDGVIINYNGTASAFMSATTVDYSNCDFYIRLGSVSGTSYSLAVRLNYHAKLIRSILIGLGYNLNPFSSLVVNTLKIIAYFKAYYSIFMNSRDQNYFMTNAYKYTQYISQNYVPATNTRDGYLFGVLNDLAHCYFNLPADYFSASTINNVNTGSIDSYVGNTKGVARSVSSGDNTNAITVGDDSGNINVNANAFPLLQRLAQYALKFANKHSIVGKNIHDWLVSEYGVSAAHDDIHEEVVKLGASKVPIQISDVMSTAETEEAKLGEFAGRGIGFGKTETFNFDSKTFGVYIVISVVVPENATGYFQGILRENLSLASYDFFTPDFDAIGYQTLGNAELTVDYTHEGGITSNCQASDINTFINGSFGLMPRYSHLKVGRDIVNGDLSLPTTRDEMSAYHLDRIFQNYSTYLYAGIPLTAFYPTNDSSFRKIGDGDSYGKYERIFGYQYLDYDHFIIQSNVHVSALMPAKPISESYDTFEDSSHTVEFNKV